MELNAFLEKLKNDPESVEFNDTMEVVEQSYDYTATAFTNGSVKNEAGQNEG